MPRVDVFVLHPPEFLELSANLCAALSRHRLTCAHGTTPEPCRLMLWLQGAPPPHWESLALSGTAVLPLGNGGWFEDRVGEGLEARPQRMVAAIAAFLDQTGSGLLGDAEVDRALSGIQTALDALATPSLNAVCEFLEHTIRQGAPLYNAGSPHGCALIYLEATRGLIDCLPASSDTDPLLAAVATELARVLIEVDTETPFNPDRVAWGLRSAFDRILIARHTADAIQTLDELFRGLRSAGRSLSACLLHDLLRLAISRGEPVYEAGGRASCAQIYLHAAQGVLNLLSNEAQVGEGRAASLARESLVHFVSDAEARLQREPDELAWDLRNAFDTILEVAADERSWEHDS